MNALNSKEAKEIYSLLKEQFGFDRKLDYFFFEDGNKINVTNKEVSFSDIDTLRVRDFGVCIGTKTKEGIILTVEGSQIIGKDCNKNIVEISDEQVRDWLRGLDVYAGEEFDGLVMIKNKNDFFGCGKANKGKIWNLLDKSRRLKSLD